MVRALLCDSKYYEFMGLFIHLHYDYSYGTCKNILLFLDRTYQCFGQWEEDGLLYTYTRRRDLPNVYECFVGGSSMAASDRLDANLNTGSQRKISIIESGFNCKRGLNVNEYGMPLTKKRELLILICYGADSLYPEKSR